eukprot:2510172-Amphidinium_carterae.1
MLMIIEANSTIHTTIASHCSNLTLRISSTCRRPLVFAFSSLTACSARPFPELSLSLTLTGFAHDDLHAFSSKFFPHSRLQRSNGMLTVAAQNDLGKATCQDLSFHFLHVVGMFCPLRRYDRSVETSFRVFGTP